MLRFEIIANNAVEEDIMEALIKSGAGKFYTRLNNVHGSGYSDPKMGDPVWPEENFILIIYCSDEEGKTVVSSVESVRGKFPNEGIRCFCIPYTEY
jgi:hypothetical protein